MAIVRMKLFRPTCFQPLKGLVFADCLLQAVEQISKDREYSTFPQHGLYTRGAEHRVLRHLIAKGPKSLRYTTSRCL